MTIVNGTLGNADRIFPPSTTLRHQITLPREVVNAKALLRGFKVGFNDSDEHLLTNGIRLGVEYGDAPNMLSIVASVHLTSNDWAATNLEVDYTLIAE